VELTKNNVTENVTVNVTENKLKSREQNIIKLTKENNTISVELAEKLFVTPRTIIRDIEKLKQLGILKRIGPAKGGHWEISINP